MEEKEEVIKSKKSLPVIILGIAVIALAIGVVLLLTKGSTKDSGGGGNSEQDDPINQNEVVIDGFTYAPLKLETNETNLIKSLAFKYFETIILSFIVRVDFGIDGLNI